MELFCVVKCILLSIITQLIIFLAAKPFYAKWIHAKSIRKFIVQNCSDTISIEYIKETPGWNALVDDMRKSPDGSPGIIMLNSHALRDTQSWACNVEVLSPRVKERVWIISVDSEAHQKVASFWPKNRTFHIDVPCLKERFSFGSGEYQAFFVLRANLVAAILSESLSVWMLQQDTFWRRNLFQYDLPNTLFPLKDAIFDRQGFDEESRRNWCVNGANWFVRPTQKSKEIFKLVAEYQTDYWTQDIGILMYYCNTGYLNCGYAPYRVISGWEWFYSARKESSPGLIQLDGGIYAQLGHQSTQDANSIWKPYSLTFLNEVDQSCNSTLVRSALDRYGQETGIRTPPYFNDYVQSFLSINENSNSRLFDLPFVGHYIKLSIPLLTYWL